LEFEARHGFDIVVQLGHAAEPLGDT